MAAGSAQIEADVLNLLRRGQLGDAARVLSSNSSPSPDIEMLTSRLRRMCGQALEKAATPDQVAALVPVILCVSPTDELTPAIASALTGAVQKHLESISTTSETVDADRWLGALAPLLAERSVAGALFDVVLDLAERTSDKAGHSTVLLNLCSKWREKGYEGLSDERLTRLAGLLPARPNDTAAGMPQ